MKLLNWSLGATLVLFIVTGSYLTFRNHFEIELRPERLQQAAQADLALIAAAQEKFHASHGTFTTDLSSLGVKPRYTYYKIGFIKPAHVAVADVPNHNAGIIDLDILKTVRTDLQIQLSKETKLEAIKLPNLADLCLDCTATKDTFKAIAAANLDADAALDVWTVDETGKYVHVIDDLKTN